MFKQWTVILIPHDRGQRRSFRLSSLQIWVVVGLFTGLSFSTVFFYRKGQATYVEANRALASIAQPEAAPQFETNPEIDEEPLSVKEAELRVLYEARDRAITDELNRLYDLEREVRIISGLPARTGVSAETLGTEQEGQGGTPGDPDAGLSYEDDPRMAPPALIYGLSNPSADMMLEEMHLRLRSLARLVSGMNEQLGVLAHTPSIWPTNDPRRRINSHFGIRRDPFTKQSRTHSGVDITSSYGSPVLATADGMVIFSGYQQYLGHLVKIDHGNGTQTWYGHLSKRLVDKGEVVQRGTPIGKVGSTGRATGPHLHYEVHVNGARVDPRNYIGQ